jgi:exopolysaccharide biosynthesis polyprenyl glycosylphosphotransferase
MLSYKNVLSFWFLVLPTTALFYLGLFLTIKIRYPKGLAAADLRIHLLSFTIIYALWLIVFFSHKLFDFTILRRYTIVFFSLVSAMVVNLLVAIIYFYLQPNLIITPRRFLLEDVIISFFLALCWYLLVKYFLRVGRTERVYLFSLNSQLDDLEQEIQKHDFLGFKVAGYLDEKNLENLPAKVNASIILPANMPNNSEIFGKFYNLRQHGVTFYDYEDFYENLLQRVSLSQLNEAWFLENIDYNEKFFYQFIKRLIDLVFAIILFILFIITFPIISLLIKATSDTDVFFVQTRVGRHGQLFSVYKYRTMKGDVNDTWTEKNDSRITGFGKFLRRTRLDELPQFINLLVGNMSLVGPRPEQEKIMKSLLLEIPFYEERHMVKPGLTGWGQLNVYAASIDESKLKLQYDLYYIKRRSLRFDLEIIFKTFYYIITGSGR